MKKYVAALLILVLALGLFGCGEKEETPKDLVKVGDTVITSSQLNEYVELYAYIQQMDLSTIKDEAQIKNIKSIMLEDLISLESMKQHFAGRDAEILPETVEEDLKSFIDESKNTEGVAEYLEEKGISDDTLKDFFLSQYYAKAYFDEIRDGMENLDETTAAYYESNKEFYKADEVTASHILVKEEALAKEILQKLKGGADFAALAKEYGTDGTKDAGGSLGTFGRGAMVAEFEEVAFALQPGELSDVVKTEFGYHIIKVTDKNQGYRTLDEVRTVIEGSLIGEVADGKIAALKEKLGVEYLTEEYTGEPTGAETK